MVGQRWIVAATGDTTVLPWGEEPDRQQAARRARLVDVDVPDRWLHRYNWVTELYDDEVHPATTPPTERVMPRLQCWAALGQAHGAWIAVAEDRPLSGPSRHRTIRPGRSSTQVVPSDHLAGIRLATSCRRLTPFDPGSSTAAASCCWGKSCSTGCSESRPRFTYDLGWSRAVLKTSTAVREARHRPVVPQRVGRRPRVVPAAGGPPIRSAPLGGVDDTSPSHVAVSM